ncbi:MAG: ROK family protein [Elusimicrobia bacterium]|nr:ROK family protein [Elusimicrobiota bacterium]
MIGIGIDIGATNTKMAVVNNAGKILKETKFRTADYKTCGSFIKELCRITNEWKKEFDPAVKSIGMGIAGDVDPEKGILRFSPNLRGWKNVELAGPVKKQTGLFCVLENDANMAAWGAYAVELKKKYKNVLAVTLGTGVGGGLIINGNLYHGSNGSAGEIGHVKIAEGGRICHCGAGGCMEAYVGSYALMDYAASLIRDTGAFVRKYSGPEQRASGGTAALRPQVSEAMPTTSSGVGRSPRHQPGWCGGYAARPERVKFNTICLTRAAAGKNKTALKIWHEFGVNLGKGLSGAVLILNPASLVFTGGVSKASKYFMSGLKEVFSRQTIKTPFERLKIVVSQNADLGCLGAALFGIEKYINLE